MFHTLLSTKIFPNGKKISAIKESLYDYDVQSFLYVRYISRDSRVDFLQQHLFPPRPDTLGRLIALQTLPDTKQSGVKWNNMGRKWNVVLRWRPTSIIRENYMILYRSIIFSTCVVWLEGSTRLFRLSKTQCHLQTVAVFRPLGVFQIPYDPRMFRVSTTQRTPQSCSSSPGSFLNFHTIPACSRKTPKRPPQRYRLPTTGNLIFFQSDLSACLSQDMLTSRGSGSHTTHQERTQRRTSYTIPIHQANSYGTEFF